MDTIHLTETLERALKLDSDRSFFITEVGLGQLNAALPSKRDLKHRAAKRGITEEETKAILDELVQSGHLLRISGERALRLHGSLYGYFRTGLKAFLEEFVETMKHDAIDLVAEFVHDINAVRSDAYFDEERARENTVDTMHRVESRSPFVEAMEQLGDWDLASIAVLAQGQYALDGGALDLLFWTSMLKPSLRLRKDLATKVSDERGSLYQSDWVEPQNRNAKKEVRTLVPTATTINRWGLDRKLIIPSDASARSFEAIGPDDLPQRELIYPEALQSELSTIAHRLQGERFEETRKNLKERGQAGGLSILMVGPSGTGKTTCVSDWAKSSGRALVRVDLSALRGRYMGESESQTRALFRDLQLFRERQEREPIVLLDEADGFLHRRSAHEGDDVHLTEANLITIFLTELDRFDGILVGTSNHTHTIDPAFHRRFLFTLSIPEPDECARLVLVRKFFPHFNERQVADLARTQFTPAQLELAFNQALMMGQTLDFESTRRRLNSISAGWKTAATNRPTSPMGFRPSTAVK